MNILITSVGRRSYLVKYFKEALGKDGQVHVMNSSDISPAFNVADKSTISPLIYDENYINFLIKYCTENNIKIVISLFDVDVFMLAKNKKKFEENGIKLIVSNSEFVGICNDKWETYNFFVRNGINTPKTYLDKTAFYSDLENMKISFPVIVKPRWGMGSLSIFQADDIDELEIFYKKIKNQILSSYLKYESQNDMNNCVIIQEKIVGNEYGLDIINDLDSNYINTIIKRKYAMRSGETDCAEIVTNDDIVKIAKKISSLSKHIANLDVDLFLDSNSKPYFLEMNSRFGGGYPFSHIAGVNLPRAIIKWYKSEKVDISELTAQVGIIAHKDIDIVKIKKKEC